MLTAGTALTLPPAVAVPRGLSLLRCPLVTPVGAEPVGCACARPRPRPRPRPRALRPPLLPLAGAGMGAGAGAVGVATGADVVLFAAAVPALSGCAGAAVTVVAGCGSSARLELRYHRHLHLAG